MSELIDYSETYACEGYSPISETCMMCKLNEQCSLEAAEAWAKEYPPILEEEKG